MTDTTIIKHPNNGGCFLQNWNIKCNDKNGNGKISKIIRSLKTNSSTPDSAASALPPTGVSFMYIETSSNNNNRESVFVSFERTNIVQITYIRFYYNGFSSSDVNLRVMRRFRTELILEDDTWSTRYLKNHISRLSLVFKNNFMKLNEKYLDYN